ncbi:hypothetical protein Enr13x_58490 [Stieleria neptunia]|uniref:Uncharacterized protein n=1 Tax=Stieleria neptunia TaxID=2527979 RepID=A0A518HYL5_9BACT|nr:hypothetical protein Enr13x_58490 [Stieleria neptunia]
MVPQAPASRVTGQPAGAGTALRSQAEPGNEWEWPPVTHSVTYPSCFNLR